MERLTYWCPDEMGGGEWRANIRGTEVEGEEINRLAAYENSDLTPEAVMALAEALREGRILVAPRNMAEKRVYANTVPVKDLYDEDGGDVLGGGDG